ncbi:uncharacterized protein BX664DRAFT_338127 [Halteromyces radiatus]|uniref:uncharacterized protein n=1 Tax=Halteromyces radiatus TaxID=101107 RepID=UPI0022201C4B|nr:uncharacterized protein BX664DRAFT_338127 [Halteromyces radiatus]KAI8084928.1 hypothetical protein BX664DRAFT_338127 [Halteromyces radiatus]
MSFDTEDDLWQNTTQNGLDWSSNNNNHTDLMVPSNTMTSSLLTNHHHSQQQQQQHPMSSSTSPPTPTSTNINTSMTTNNIASSFSSSSSTTTNNETKITHPEWGVMKDQEFHPLAHKHQRDLENIYQSNSALSDFYFWQASLGGYCMADMVQNIVVSSDQAFVLVRQIVDGPPPPGRKKKGKNNKI